MTNTQSAPATTAPATWTVARPVDKLAARVLRALGLRVVSHSDAITARIDGFADGIACASECAARDAVIAARRAG